MEFATAWCPACDKQIAPKRTIIKVPKHNQPLPPAPPPSPKRSKGKNGGLVSGTGRLRHNGTIKAAAAPPLVMKEKVVIDQGLTPLYCSDECQMADLRATTRQVPLDPAIEEPKQQHPPSSIDQLIKMYNLPPLPEIPVAAPEPVAAPLPWTNGIMMAGKLIDSLCPPSQKPQTGRYRVVDEPPRKQTKGWDDGSNAWREAVYDQRAGTMFDERHPEAPPPNATAFFYRHASSRSSASVSSPSSEKLLADFSSKFVHSSSLSAASSPAASRARSMSSISSAPSTSSSMSTHRRERSLVHKGAEGKLVVPDVKLKVAGASSVSLASAYSARKTVRSPLSATSMSMGSYTSSESEQDEDDDDHFDTEFVSSLSQRVQARRAMQQNTRSWSYDNMLTYDAMPVHRKVRKVQRMETQIIDGEERTVRVEVEEVEEAKCLFNFAPNLIKTSSL
ncbi:hypothetical protein CPC08DRAFT_718628 [Agrocybe pediades]|nr:hypothetical protein CPC08DRAFT_718628 [Agrocybe pediades]